jgi:hypothetical protein
MTEYTFAAFTLELETPLHLGNGRAGMVAKSHAFVPGHLFGYALAVARGRELGGRPEHFQAALAEVALAARFAPALPLDASGQVEADWPEHPERYLGGQHHVALRLDSRSAADSALFEVEQLLPRYPRDFRRGQTLRLGGGLWYHDEHLGGRPWPDWLARLRLGGELKTGLGRVRLVGWTPGAADFHGWGAIDAAGLQLKPEQRLWGPALDSVPGLDATPLRPWLGRRHDYSRGTGGSGRLLSAAILVRLHARTRTDLRPVWPCAIEGGGWGCWEAVAADGIDTPV